MTMSIACLSSSAKIDAAALAPMVTISSVTGAILISFNKSPLLSFSGSMLRAAAKFSNFNT